MDSTRLRQIRGRLQTPSHSSHAVLSTAWMEVTCPTVESQDSLTQLFLGVDWATPSLHDTCGWNSCREPVWLGVAQGSSTSSKMLMYSLLLNLLSSLTSTSGLVNQNDNVEEFVNLMFSFSLFPVNTRPTRITTTTATLTDYIWTTQVSLNTGNYIIDTDITDHFPTISQFTSCHFKQTSKTITKRYVTSTTLQEFKYDLF